MMYCIHCGKEIPDDSAYCPFCGKQCSIDETGGQIGENGQWNKEKRKRRKTRGIIVLAIAVVILVGAGIFAAVCNQLTIKAPKTEETGAGNTQNDEANVLEKQAGKAEAVIVGNDDCYYKEINEMLVAVIPDTDTRFIKNEMILMAGEDIAKEAIEAVLEKYQGKIVGYLGESGFYQAEFAADISYEQLLETKSELEQEPEIELAELNLVSTVFDEGGYYPNDEWYKGKWTKANAEWKDGDEKAVKGPTWGLEAIRAPYAWEFLRKQDTQKVTLGIFEAGGVNSAHEDLGDVLMRQSAEEKKNADHGTAVAGIIGATADNGIGMVGVIPDASLIGIGHGGSKEKLEVTEGQDLSLMACEYAMEYLIVNIEANTPVINMSLGSTNLQVAASNGSSKAISELTQDNSVLTEHLKRLLKRNHEFLLVKSAGNASETKNENRFYKYIRADEGDSDAVYGYIPVTQDNEKKLKKKYKDFNARLVYGNVDAKYDIYSYITDQEIKDRILVVGAVAPGESSISGYSSGGERVDILAPGEGMGVLTTNGYTEDSGWGTSYAAPYVTGVAGLVLSIKPDMSGADLKKLLIKTAGAEYSGQINGKTYTCKLVNALNAVKEACVLDAEEAKNENPTPTPTITELREHMDDFAYFYQNIVGGNPSDETGDHENWIIGDGIQYGNYLGSSSVDEISLENEKYSIYGIYTGMNLITAEERLTQNNWKLEERGNGFIELENGSENIIIHFNIVDNQIDSISYYKDMIEEQAQGEMGNDYIDESSSNAANEETSGKDIETVGKLLEDYYNNLSETDGRYGVSLSEARSQNDSFFYIVRYAASEEESAEIIKNGGIPTANKLVTGVYVDKNTGVATDDWNNSWNLW